MKKQTVRDINLKHKTVLVRVDYNMPLGKKGEIEDTLRIEATRETIGYLLKQDCRIVLISHLGRPDGKPDPKFSLKPVAQAATKVLKHKVEFVPDCIGPVAEAAVAKLEPGEIILLENVRFHPGDESNDATYAKQLAKGKDAFVFDAFAVAHRDQASTTGVAKLLPAVAGLLLEREVDTITAALNKPKRPLFAVIGGAKISTKIDVIQNLLKKVDILLIGGAMANTFLAAQGFEVGKSLYEKDQFATALKIVDQCEKVGIDLILPLDVVVAKKIEAGAHPKTIDLIEVQKDDIIVDIGPKTIESAVKPIGLAGTVIWNGPVGITEVPEFSKGSQLVAKKIADSNAESIIGGGDTAAYVDGAGMHSKFSFVSTGGGASLELMARKALPAVEALRDK